MKSHTFSLPRKRCKSPSSSYTQLLYMTAREGHQSYSPQGSAAECLTAHLRPMRSTRMMEPAVATICTAPWMIAIFSADASLWFSTLRHEDVQARPAWPLVPG